MRVVRPHLAGHRILMVQLVTIANRLGELRAGWIPAGLVEFPDDLVVIHGEPYTVVTVGDAIAHRTNILPQWRDAESWIQLTYE